MVSTRNSLNGSFSSTRENSKYSRTSNIGRTLVGNKILDHSDVAGHSDAVCPSTPLQPLLHSRRNARLQWIEQRQLQTRQETFKFQDLLRLTYVVFRNFYNLSVQKLWIKQMLPQYMQHGRIYETLTALYNAYGWVGLFVVHFICCAMRMISGNELCYM